MSKTKKKSKTAQKLSSPFNNYWTRENYALLGLGLLIVIIGFIMMAQGPYDNPVSLTYSPLVLLVAYLVVFPLAIFYRKKKSADSADVSGKN